MEPQGQPLCVRLHKRHAIGEGQVIGQPGNESLRGNPLAHFLKIVHRKNFAIFGITLTLFDIDIEQTGKFFILFYTLSYKVCKFQD